RAAETGALHPVEHVDPSAMLGGERLGQIAGAVRRAIVHDENANVGMRHQARDERREIVALVERRYDDERVAFPGGCHRRLSNRSEEICSDTSPTSRMTTLSRISSTEELVTCDCVAIVHAAYTAPR